MVKRTAGFLIMCAALLSLSGCGEKASLTLANGEQQQLSDYRGQWLVVNYFAEWCAPCLREMPLLNELSASQGPAVLAVSYDKLSGAELQGLAARYQMTMPVVLELTGEWPFDTPNALPTTMILDPKGNLVDSVQGELKPEDLTRWQTAYWSK
ncbi:MULTISPECIES: TlpA family protein disulfide reductase [Oceanisphaera]|uniref:TlpA family protein disulfide reductase n=1 Tax=Oceanisphaera ostreae TaxID=914151 RepID=A0ABW3KEZ8_9GAMM